jgi:hypothetical protein
MIFVYVDDVLAISHWAKDIFKMIRKYYKVKPRSDKEPEIYLGVNIEKVQMPVDREVWASLPCDYVKNAIKTVEDLFEDGEGYVLRTKSRIHFL